MITSVTVLTNGYGLPRTDMVGRYPSLHDSLMMTTGFGSVTWNTQPVFEDAAWIQPGGAYR